MRRRILITLGGGLLSAAIAAFRLLPLNLQNQSDRPNKHVRIFSDRGAHLDSLFADASWVDPRFSGGRNPYSNSSPSGMFQRTLLRIENSRAVGFLGFGPSATAYAQDCPGAYRSTSQGTCETGCGGTYTTAYGDGSDPCIGDNFRAYVCNPKSDPSCPAIPSYMTCYNPGCEGS